MNRICDEEINKKLKIDDNCINVLEENESNSCYKKLNVSDDFDLAKGLEEVFDFFSNKIKEIK